MISKATLSSGRGGAVSVRPDSDALPPVCWGWLAAVVAAIAYGSLMPFEFVGGVDSEPPLGLAPLGSVLGPVSDRLVNVGLFVPVGLLFVLGVDRRGSIMRGSVPAVVLSCTISLLLETIQTRTPSRVASWYDVSLNVTGAAVGVGLAIAARIWGPSLLRSAAHQVQTQLFRTCSVALAVGLFAYELYPFDFVTSSEALFRSFRAAQWGLFEMRAVPIGEPPFTSFVHQVSGAVWFAVLAFLAALANRQRRRPPGVSFASAVKHCVLLVCLIEGMQLFAQSHVVDIASVALRALGVIVGAWTAVFIVDEHSRGGWQSAPDAAAWTPLLAIALVWQVILLVLGSVGYGEWRLLPISFDRIFWMPFRTLWEQTPVVAAGNVASALACYAALAFTLAHLGHRLGGKRPWVFSASGTMVLAVAVEAIKAGSASRTADVTDILLAIFGVALARTVGRALRALRDAGPSFTAARPVDC